MNLSNEYELWQHLLKVLELNSSPNPMNENQEVPSPQNERLSWTHYRWCVISYTHDLEYERVILYGTNRYNSPPLLKKVRRDVMEDAARGAKEEAPGLWNPFNIRIAIVPIQHES